MREERGSGRREYIKGTEGDKEEREERKKVVRGER